MSFNVNVMKDPKGYIPMDCIKRLLDLAKSRSIRDYTLLFTLYKTGRRVSEVLDLKASDIDTKNNTILWTFLKRKQETRRWLEVDQELLTVLNDYVDILDIVGEDKLFPISRQRVFQLVRWYGEKTDNLYIGNKKIHPHHFRHSFAVNYIKAGNNSIEDLKFIQEYLGHSSIAMTSWYLQFGKDIYTARLKKMPKFED